MKSNLADHVPQNAVEWLNSLLQASDVQLNISRPRKTKLGDFRVTPASKQLKISVNRDLSKVHFMYVFLHEIAHAQCYRIHRGRIQPHGNEWKNTFSALLQMALNKNYFPEDLKPIIFSHIQNPPASSLTDLKFARWVTQNNPNLSNEKMPLEALEIHQQFTLDGNRIFEKLNKRRKRYKCIEINTKKTYLVHPLAMVSIVNK